jgi:hypothetical protein
MRRVAVTGLGIVCPVGVGVDIAWEAMAAGIAVVSSRYVGSGLEGALMHGSNSLLFPVGDAREAAAQLASLRNPAGLRELGAAGFDLVKRRYSRDASQAAWMAAFQAVAALAPLPVPGRAVPIAAAGGLDRRLGPETAERLRRPLRRRFRHREAGSEWPHSSHVSGDDASLLELAGALDRATGTIEHRVFRDLPSYLHAGDALVLNTTRVFRARLLGRRDSGASAEVFLLRELDDDTWEAMVQ